MEAMRTKWTDERLDERATTVDGRFDRLESHMDARFENVNSRFDRIEKRLDWLIGMFIATVVALIAVGVFGG